MVAPRSALFDAHAPQGFYTAGVGELISRIYQHYRFVPRSLAENDPGLKQIIPYAVVTRNRGVFVLRRFNNQDESQLRDKYSLGVGGHVNPLPFMSTGMVEKGLRRELNEEIFIPDDYRARLVGFINDDSNAVGSVHLGIVYHITTASQAVKVRETELMSGEFRSPADLARLRPKMETWSQLLADNIELFLKIAEKMTA
jgi:predicted NUDIX family phosphoesterase